jgi:hypothetical protein
MAWTDIFGGQTVNPQDLSYKSYSFAANVSLLWDNTTAESDRVVADIMDIAATVAGVTVTMPDARQAGAGAASLIFNAGAESFNVVSATGVAIATLAPGQGWYVWLRDNTTEGGLWRAIEFGAGTSTASAASLASATVKASGAALVQAMPVFTLGVDYTTGAGERGKLIRWSGGVGTLTLDLAATVGGDWFCAINNSGTGTLTIAPSGSDQIDASASSITLNPGDTFSLASDGANYFSWAKSFSPINQFTFTSISVAGTGDFTLSSVQLGFSLYEFTGLLTGNRNIIVPAAVAPFRVINSTTGAFSLTVKTAAGTGVAVLQNGSKFLACTGTNVVDVVSLGISTPISVADGGTGATTASGARTNLGATSLGGDLFTTASAAAARTSLGATVTGGAVFTAADTAAARAAIGAVIGTDVQAYDVDLAAIAGLTSAADKVPYFTGAGTAAVADFTAAGRALVDDADAAAQRTTLGLGTIATQDASNVAITGGAISGITDLAVADGGTGASTALAARANLGLAWELIGTTTVSSSTATIDFTDLSAYRRLRMSGYVIPATDNVFIFLRTSSNNGSTYDAGASAYSHVSVRGTNSTATGFGLGTNTTGAASGIQISGTSAVGALSANEGTTFALEIHEFNQTLFAKVNGHFYTIVEDASILTGAFGGHRVENVARNALRIVASSGNISRAFVTLEGIRT